MTEPTRHLTVSDGGDTGAPAPPREITDEDGRPMIQCHAITAHLSRCDRMIYLTADAERDRALGLLCWQHERSSPGALAYNATKRIEILQEQLDPGPEPLGVV